MEMEAPTSNGTVANPISIILFGGFHAGSTVLLNGISLLMIFRNQEIPGRVKICFTGQVVTDLAVGVSTVMMIMANFEGVYCYISLYMTHIFGAITSFMALLQTVDRFLVLRITYAYTAWMSKKKMAAIVVILYVISTAAILATMYRPVDESEICYPTTSGGRYGYVLYIIIIFVCSTSISCLYIYIGVKVRRLQKFTEEQERIQARLKANSHRVQDTVLVNAENNEGLQADENNEVTQRGLAHVDVPTRNGGMAVGKEGMKVGSDGLSKNATLPDNMNGISKSQKEPSDNKKGITKSHKKPSEKKPRNPSDSVNMKVLITMVISASLYGLCYLPLAVISIFVDVNWDTRDDFVAENSLMLTVCGVLVTSNSLLNPLVYIWRLKSFQVDCKTICCKSKS